MKTNRIRFSLEKYESGKYKVVTRDGRSVRIVCTNCKNVCSIVALIKTENGIEGSYSYYPDGKSWGHTYSDIDLLLEETIFEDGDIVTNEKDIAIYKEIDKCYCGISEQGCLAIDAFFYYEVITRLATEAEKQRLFDALKKDGKRWNADKKCIEEMFNKDIFQPFQRVLVRNFDSRKWSANLFSHYADIDSLHYFICVGNESFNQCIPFEGNEELLGTTKSPK